MATNTDTETDMSTDTETGTDTETQSMAEAIRKVMGVSMDTHVASAIDKLQDDEIVAFGLVAIRKHKGSYQNVSHRAIDPDAMHESSDPNDEFVDDMHESLCTVFDETIRDR